jgi:hypothetical protein
MENGADDRALKLLHGLLANIPDDVRNMSSGDAVRVVEGEYVRDARLQDKADYVLSVCLNIREAVRAAPELWPDWWTAERVGRFAPPPSREGEA